MSEEDYDITGKIGELFPRERRPEWPMFSYSRPGSILWNAIAARLSSKGWSEERIGEWLRSKGPRHELDGDLGDALIALGKKFADQMESFASAPIVG